jgi:hypothetical protein
MTMQEAADFLAVSRPFLIKELGGEAEVSDGGDASAGGAGGGDGIPGDVPTEA